MSATVAVREPNRRWVGLIWYLALLLAGVGLFFVIRSAGAGLQAPVIPEAPAVGRTQNKSVDVVFHVTATLAAVIGLGFLLGRLGRLAGQPPVIGEVLAGILLGPSLLGAIWPEGMHFLIPSSAEDPGGKVPAGLKAISQLGIILYMFLIGLQLNAARLKHQAQSAILISHVSIVVPFVLGAALALGLYPVYSHSGVPFTSFALFLGVAMAVTAFPVLARILTDRGLDKTEIGIIALSCAAADDVTAWCLLALVVGVAQSQAANVIVVAVAVVVFLAFMLLVLRPLLLGISQGIDSTTEPISPSIVSFVFLGVLLSALTTELIGVHAVFGAFVFGAILPHDGRLAREFASKLKDPVTVLMLPAFFAFTGMRTQIGLVTNAEDLLWCVAVVIVATLGKFGGTLAAARLTGHPWRESAALGVLMNTRGLMGLIVLEIGLDLGVIGPRLFTILVLMALMTTIATSPILGWLIRTRKSHVSVAGGSPSLPSLFPGKS